ncbi:MAG: hypothetical protein ACRYG2_20810, partial [Janthinobacterium lividum]
MDRELEGVVTWRGPAPFHFVAVPDDVCAGLAAVAAQVTYGWGMVPARLASRASGSRSPSEGAPADPTSAGATMGRSRRRRGGHMPKKGSEAERIEEDRL